MPNNMDLDDIRNWRTERMNAPATGDVAANPLGNIFLEEPTKVCENRESL